MEPGAGVVAVAQPPRLGLGELAGDAVLGRRPPFLAAALGIVADPAGHGVSQVEIPYTAGWDGSEGVSA